MTTLVRNATLGIEGLIRSLPQIVAGWIVSASNTVSLWQQRHQERRLLLGLDDRMLKDIGLSRADIECEISKPFWQG